MRYSCLPCAGVQHSLHGIHDEVRGDGDVSLHLPESVDVSVRGGSVGPAAVLAVDHVRREAATATSSWRLYTGQSGQVCPVCSYNNSQSSLHVTTQQTLRFHSSKGKTPLQSNFHFDLKTTEGPEWFLLRHNFCRTVDIYQPVMIHFLTL